MLFRSKQPVTEVTLELSSASRELDHLVTLLRERLARVALPSAVIEIALHSGRITPLASRNRSFLPDDPGAADSALRLIERLHARLGADALQGVMPWPDHRPEHAWRACVPTLAGVPVSSHRLPISVKCPASGIVFSGEMG